MIPTENHDRHEAAFRRTGRWIWIMLELFIPIMFGGFGLNDIFHSELPLTIYVAVFLAVLIYISILRFVAYYRKTGRYPFYWLRR